MGEGAVPRPLDQIAAAEEELTSLARRLFAAWFERVVGAEPRGDQAPSATAAATSSALS